MLKQLIMKTKNKIWFLPGLYSFASLLTAVLTILLDNNYSQVLRKFIPDFMMTDIGLAQTILSSLMAALLTMTAITFSTIMVVLTTYSSQFSPRTLEDFITDRTTLRVLGIFMGGFIYSVLTLLFIKNGDSDSLVFSSVFGVAISIVCLAFFVYFIHHVSVSIQVNRLIDRLASDVLSLVEKIEKVNDSDKRIKNEAPEQIQQLDTSECFHILSNNTGYIQMIDELRLLRLADTKDILIRVEKMVGDYVTTNSVILSIWNHEGPIDSQEDFLKSITIGSQRNMKQDIEFGLQKLVEVALKALSPGINDPNTAIECIHKLGMILAKIGTSNLRNTYYYNRNNEVRLIFEDKSFEEMLYKTFFQLRHYSTHDVSVIAATLDALALVAEQNKRPLKDTVWDFSSCIIGGFNVEVLETLDKRYIVKKIRRLAYLTGNLKSEKYRKVLSMMNENNAN